MQYPNQPKGDSDNDPDVILDVKPSQTILNSCNETVINFERPSIMNETQIIHKARNPKIAEIDVLFPKIKFLKASFDTPYDPNRFLDFSYSVFFFYFVTCVKFFMVKEFGIATFCDIQKWEIFDQKVSENEIEMMQTLNCSEKCNDNTNIVLTKVFESNYYFFYSINVFFLMYYSLRQKFKGPLLIFLTVSPYLNHFIGHVLYFWDKSFAFMIGNFLYVSEVVVMIKISFVYLKMFSAVLLFIGFFSGIKFFFEAVFPLMVERDPERTLAVVPILLFFIKLFGKVLFSYYPYFKRCDPKLIANMLISFIFFEYVYIGTLHTLINKYGLASYSFWLTMFQSFLMDMLGRTNFLSKIYILFTRRRNEKKKKVDEFSIFYLYYGIKEELELYSKLIYFMLLSTNYYDYCMTPLVDCMGSPMINVSPIRHSHFLLVLILLLESALGFFIVRASKIVWGDNIVKKVNVKFDTLMERSFYICMLFGVSINFGMPGLYSMMISG